MNPKSLGHLAEDTACEYLIKRGYEVLQRNYRTRLGEIDIVAEKNGALSFVEVKAGKSDPDFSPQDHFDFNKRRKLKTLVQAYLSGLSEVKPAQIDLLVIVEKEGRFQVDHFQDVTED